jgi:hypothetical protein
MVGLVNVDVGQAVGSLFGLIDSLFTTDEERANAKLKVLELHSKGDLAQLAVNTAEAASESLFVSGWRPFIGWVCGAAFAYSFLIQPFFAFVSWATFAYSGEELPLSTLPVLDLAMMMPVLMGMLGLGGLRTFEKHSSSYIRKTFWC